MKNGKREAQPMPETITTSFLAMPSRLKALATPSVMLK